MPRMMARVKEDSRFNPITACSGFTFLKDRWLYVPAGFEEEATNNPHLETAYEEDIFSEEEPEPESEVTPVFVENDIEEGEGILIYHATDSAVAYAEEHGIDLSEIEGTGKDGKITLTDVKDAEGA